MSSRAGRWVTSQGQDGPDKEGGNEIDAGTAGVHGEWDSTEYCVDVVCLLRFGEKTVWPGRGNGEMGKWGNGAYTGLTGQRREAGIRAKVLALGTSLSLSLLGN